MAVFPPIEDLIPHRGSMRLVERVIAARGDSIVCAGRIPRENAFVDQGRAPCFVALELAAQAAAAHGALASLRAGQGAAPQEGYLVSVRDARFALPEVPAGRRLIAVARLVGFAPPLSHYAVEVRGARGPCVEAVLATYATSG